eukprot:gene4176-5943_t
MENWHSRRSPILSMNGVCSSSQPLASSVGIKILQNGGNAADAAVAMAAALNVIEPCSTGIGGDAFALYYDSSTRKVSCLQGNGRSSSVMDLNLMAKCGYVHGEKELDSHSGLCITVPGAAALWEDLLSNHGRLNLHQVLTPAIELAEKGFPIPPITAAQWSRGFLQGEEAHRVFRPNGISPRTGDVVKNIDLASTFRTIAEKGVRNGFYNGKIAQAIIEATASFGGVLTQEDLDKHFTDFEEPISLLYKGIRVYEPPPPTHGVAVLTALGMLEQYEKSNNLTSTSNASSNSKLSSLVEDIFAFDTNKTRRSSDYEAHIAIESMRLAFADALEFVADPQHCLFSPAKLINEDFVKHRSNLINKDISQPVVAGDLSPFGKSDTVYFCCVDGDGNACSMINSNYMGFGSGIVPTNTGFTLHNRGHNFSLKPGHPNQVAPSKRPYHTIIPALMTFDNDGSLFGVLGNMGGFMQPMGHLQLIRNIIDFGLDPQAAIDAPKWYIVGPGSTQSSEDIKISEILLEEGYGGRFDGDQHKATHTNAYISSGSYEEESSVVNALTQRGHKVGPIIRGDKRSVFGRGQIILRNPITGAIWAGSDGRCDGCAIPL